jgi:hypothetical protein
MRWFRLATLALALALVSPGQAAPPQVPASLTYQGVLLDDQGMPRTGFVDLTLRIHDTPLGGTLLYTQIFNGVALDGGVFTIALGPTGEATDTPVDPLTTSLSDALAGDLTGTAASRFLEVTVGIEGALARTQVLSVPYALHATSAETAETAGIATLAVDVTNVGGVSNTFVSELFEHGNSDGGGPLNSDPVEGVGDTDGDGTANFIDPDNDDDGILDTTEVTQGSDLNLATPSVSSLVPMSALPELTTAITVNGASFVPGIAVSFGSESPVPFNLTGTSFEVNVGPQNPGLASVMVTHPNGETSVPKPFEFILIIPQIDDIQPSSAPSGITGVPITVTGSGLDAGMTVSFGPESPTPTNVTATSFDVSVGPQPASNVNVQVQHPNGELSNVLPFSFVAANGLGRLVDDHHTIDVNGFVQIAVGGAADYGIDSDGDGLIDQETSFQGAGQGAPVRSQNAVAWDDLGRLAGARCGPIIFHDNCLIQVHLDTDGDRIFDSSLGIVMTLNDPVETTPRLWSPSLDFDASNNPALGFAIRENGLEVRLAHDRDGNGDFGGVNENLVLEASPDAVATNAAKLAFDASGNVAYAYSAQLAGSWQVRLAHDRNGDGDFSDTVGGVPELRSVASPIDAPACTGFAFDASGRPAVVYGGASDSVTLLRDLDDDGDFDDAGESVALGVAAAQGCDLAADPERLAVAYRDGSGGLQLRVDRNDDGDFDDANEAVLLDTFGDETDRVAVTVSAGGLVFVSRANSDETRIFQE